MGQAADLIQKVSKNATGEFTELAGQAGEFVRKHPVSTAVTVGGGVLAATQVIRIVKKRKKKTSTAKTKKKSSKKSSTKSNRKKYAGHTKRGWKQDRARRSKEKHELAYQRRKKLKSSKKTKKKVGKTYYTKNGQPYKILRSGKAKFIKGRRKK